MTQPVPIRERSDGTQPALASIHEASYGWALACCGWNRDEAQDVLQTAYLRALEGEARFDGRSSLRTWFFGVVRTTARERRRYRLVRNLALDRWFRRSPEVRAPASPELLTQRSEEHRELRRSLARLSSRQRELLHLVFYQDLTIEEAATVLGISVGTARTHYQRGKAELRALLAPAEGRDVRP